MRTKRGVALFLTIIMLVSGNAMSVFADSINDGISVESYDVTNSENDVYRDVVLDSFSTTLDETIDAIVEEDVSSSEDYSKDSVVASGQSNNIFWEIDYDYNYGAGYYSLIISGSGDYEYKTSSSGRPTPPWYSTYRIEKVVVNVKSITSCRGMFSNLRYVKEFDLSGLETSNVTDMSYMFYNCSGIADLSFLTKLKTGNVINMDYMFAKSSIANADFLNIDMRNITSMAYMFNDCKSLTDVNLSSVNETKLTGQKSVAGMFSGCSKLVNVNISNFDLSKVESTDLMFSGCTALETIDFTDVDTSNVGQMAHMFYNCQSLKSVIGLNTCNCWNMQYMFDECIGLTDISGLKFKIGGKSTSYHMLEGMFKNCTSLITADFSEWEFNEVILDMTQMFENCTSLYRFIGNDSMMKSWPTVYYMFSGCVKLSEVYFGTGESTYALSNALYMFKNCVSLKKIDLSMFYFWAWSDREFEGIFENATSLCEIKTPSWVIGEALIELPGGDWIDDDGNVYHQLPELDKSITLYRIHEEGDWEGIHYSINGTELRVYGDGAIPSIEFTVIDGIVSDNIPWADKRDIIKTVVIEEGITEIGDCAFNRLAKLESVSIPKSVNKIIDYPFLHDDKLKTIYYAGTKSDWNQIQKNSSLMSYINDYHIVLCYSDGTIDWNSKYEGSFKSTTSENETEEGSTVYNYKVDFKDFFNSSYVYQHSLTQLSIRLAMASFDVLRVDTNGKTLPAEPEVTLDTYYANLVEYKGKTPKHIRSFLTSMAFKDIEVVYPTPNGAYSIGYAIGRKEIYNSDGQKSTLISIGVRGAGYDNEWAGNAQVGYSGNHQGFNYASSMVLAGLKEYLKKYKLENQENIKVWIAGYSRAAATTNLLAAKLIDGEIDYINPNDVFAFCFECPKGTVDKNKKATKYNNIVNVINPDDLVPDVAMDFGMWNFGRYGKDYFLPSRSNTTSDEYKRLKLYMQVNYLKICNDPDLIEKRTQTGWNQCLAYNAIVSDLATLVPTRNVYCNLYQVYLMEALRTKNGFYKTLSLADFLILLLNSPVVNNAAVKTNLIETLALYSKYIGQTHYPELTISWIDSLTQEDMTKPRPFGVYIFNCPVDVMVYDENGTLVGAICDDTVQEIENGIPAYIDRNGQKMFAYSQDSNYTINVIATGEGEMTCTVQTFETDNCNPDEIVSYVGIEVTPDDEFTGKIIGENFTLSDSDGNMLTPDIDVSGEDIGYYKVEAWAEGNGSVEGYFYRTYYCLPGEFIEIKAEAKDNAKFIGWMDDEGNFLSSDEVLRIGVTKNMYVTAIFSEGSSDNCYILYDSFIKEYSELYEIKYNNQIIIPDFKPKKTGYNFLGWYTEKNGKGIKAVPTMKVRESMCFYAYWVKENCTVTFDVTDTDCYNDVSSNMLSIPSSVTVTGGEKLNLDSSDYVPSADESAPSDKYTFGGWFTAPNGEGAQYTKDTVIIDDVTLYPYWRHTGFDVLEIPDQTYTGKAIKPVIKVYDGTKLLVLNKDYTIDKYVNNTNVAGKTSSKAPSIIVKGKGNYSGTETVKFSIVKKDIGDSNVTAADISLKYNGGKALTVSPVIKYNSLTLSSKSGKDYSYEIFKYDTDVSGNTLDTYTKVSSVKDAGEYKITATGKGNYTGTKDMKLTVLNQILVEKLTVSKISDQKYTGSEITPKITVKNGKKTVPADCYNVSYTNNTEIGTATVTITGIEEKGYSGTKTVIFKITGTSISKAVIKNGDGSAFTASRAYTGTYQRPEIKVTLKVGTKTVTLEKNTDYMVSYSKNKEVGTATITVTGKGKYQGTVKKTFKITPYSLKTDTEGLIRISGTEENVLGTPVNNNGTVTFEDANKITVPYVKGGAKPGINLTWNGRVLKSGTDYTVKYYNNTAVKDETAVSGYPYLVVTGKGTFKDSIKVRFSITGRNLNEEVDDKTVTIEVADKTYSSEKNGFKSAPVLKDVNGSVLKSGTDYTVVSYTYTADTTVKNNKKSVERLAGDMVNAYDLVPAGTTLMVTVKGKGIYSQPDEEGNIGILTDTYTVREKNLSGATIKVKDQTYTGKAVEPTGSAVKVTIKEGKKTVTLTENVDYVIDSYSNNINQGSKAKITIKPCADEEGNINYSGSKTGTFTIKKKLFRWWWR